ELIPLCHPLLISGVDVTLTPDIPASVIEIRALVRCSGQTGVEMEALCAVSAAALTLYDMCKGLDQSMVISEICLLEKRGGRSGEYLRSEPTSAPVSTKRQVHG
ncbi:MAG TPA: cyclic pyranopterin monophosphate synthase MoaC, partial [Candidatus Obscuribacterales bacterium]